ncbi:hypothetical protein QJS10_CPA06g01133 [Acorus calamus]|uniref:Nucleotide-diphospho-sugar transferase domain-containing protein n=1 Tax=Acorus calamus TaxID=4465 RepID=A0AAV9EK29_ACOCL|nr:hypothetical protein QJS10_CPA06g01133 [Acorus calamus]
MKVVGSLWSIWLLGFLLIGFSLYFTHHLPSFDGPTAPLVRRIDGPFKPSVTVFSAPGPFFGPVGSRQTLAVRSWLGLSPAIDIVLFSQHPSVGAFADALGPRVSVERNIDFTFLGTPFFHSMVTRSQASTSDISVLIDPETVLLPSFISSLNHAHNLEHDWFLVSLSPTVPDFPFQLGDNGKDWVNENGEKIKAEKLQGFVLENGKWNGYSERVLMAWNRGTWPLHAGVLPPFLYGKGLHNQWVINEALSSRFRLVFDASETISSFCPENLRNQEHSLSLASDKEIKERTWEHVGNLHNAILYGTFYFSLNNYSNIPTKLVKCDGKYFFIDKVEGAVYFLGQQTGLTSYQIEPMPLKMKETFRVWKKRISGYKRKRWMACSEDSNSVERKLGSPLKISSKVALNLSASLYLPFSLESLLQMTGDEDKSIVLLVAGDSYRDMLMSFICRLHQLFISNFIVYALDLETYHFSILQGLPVFRDYMAPSNISFNDCHFGTDCFKSVTKVKSRLVLKILKLGYSVLLSDVDIYWFGNPLPVLCSFGPAVLVAQSDEYNETGPINLPRRLNSGFYFAHSDPATIAALEKVVKHASTSGLSEQPSFYDVLCGEGGINRIGDDRCLEPETNLTVHFLDQNRFPNGAFQGLWEKSDVRSACMRKGCLVIHNNWINGRKRKLERQVSSGMWEYDSSSRMCFQAWQGMT